MNANPFSIHPRAFLVAPSGRLFAATTAVALMGAGALALAGTEPSLPLLSLLVLVVVVASIMSVGLATDRFRAEAFALILALPVAGGLYLAGLTVVGELGTAAGVILLAIGAAPAWIAVRRDRRVARATDEAARPVERLSHREPLAKPTEPSDRDTSERHKRAA